MLDSSQCLLPPVLPPCVSIFVPLFLPLVVAAHRVVMDTLRARRMLHVAPPSFQAPSPSSSLVDEFKVTFVQNKCINILTISCTIC